ncbi:MAG: branched-chain amino acid ABC transporter permease [Acaryochloris sp. RU_4_1]|nr:branched-chain amino acid ABC transporter permease [Acaryochloris sp. RU_4_1]NJR55123.1 branched-chain amino acid ABC transporter permease [Acaryochloris sp. CRU_2_0]
MVANVLTLLFNGLSIASVLLLAALGLSIVFGLMGVINLAHGELIMLGAYTTYVVQEGIALLGNQWSNVYIFLALPLAFIVTALVGWGLEQGVVRHLYGRPLETLLATWGVSLILRQLVRSVSWGLLLDIVCFFCFFFGGLRLLQPHLVSTRQRYWARLIILALSVGITSTLAILLSKSDQRALSDPWFGSRNLAVTAPKWLQGGLSVKDLPVQMLKEWLESMGLENFQIPSGRLFIIALTGLCIVLMYWFLHRSSWGLRIRAVTQNRDISACLGIPTRTVDSLTFALGSGLAGVAGCAITLIGATGPNMGGGYTVDAFMVVVVGGVGNIMGSIVAAIAIGMTNYIISVGTLVPVFASVPALSSFLEFFATPSMAKVIVFGLIITFLQIRPAGIFPPKGRTAEV